MFASDLTDRCAVFANFSNPNGDFAASHDADGYKVTLKYGPGVEFAQVLVASQYAAAPTPDVRIEVDVEPLSGSDQNLFGIVCRSVGTPVRPGRWYHLLVSSGGSFVIQFTSFASSPPLERTLASGDGPALKPGINHMRADCIGTTVALFVNGRQYASVDDAGALDGMAGIYARSLDKAGAVFVFKNLVVRKG